jgi:hypothetical protein
MIVTKKINLYLALLSASAVFALYFPATTGALYYDDYSNLEALGTLSSWADIWHFVFAGEAGPLGRPLALLTFVPFSGGWPDNAQAILVFNVVIHCANFLILVALGRILLRLDGHIEPRLHFRIALGAGLLWVVMPLLASTTLIAIQRMTGLATFFGLLGLLGFVSGYALAERRPVAGFVCQMLALGMGTLLAIFSKESGAVFPVFALVIDFLLARKSNALLAAKLFNLRRLLLLLPFLFIIYYISPLHTDWWHFSEFRGMTPFQRVMTEQVVLWEYLQRAFIPQLPTAFGPFHDYYGLRPIGVITGIAAAFWFVVLVAAVVVRHRFKWFSLAVFWFLAAHMIESTSVLLELYFEHRNYAAVYGACLFISICAFTAKGRLQRIAPYLFGAYVVLLAALLLAVTVLWGQPKKAAESWNIKHPGSARAALHAVFLEMSSDSKQLEESNSAYIEQERRAFALKVLDRTKAACPDCLDIRLQALMYSCTITPPNDTRQRMSEALDVARFGRINVTVVDQLFNLQELLKANACSPLNYSNLLTLIDQLRDSSKMNVQVYGAKIYFVRAIAAQELGDTEQVWASLDEAERIAPEALPVLQYQVYFALDQGDAQRAQQALARRESQPSVISQLPEQQLIALREAISAALKESQQ